MIKSHLYRLRLKSYINKIIISLYSFSYFMKWYHRTFLSFLKRKYFWKTFQTVTWNSIMNANRLRIHFLKDISQQFIFPKEFRYCARTGIRFWLNSDTVGWRGNCLQISITVLQVTENKIRKPNYKNCFMFYPTDSLLLFANKHQKALHDTKQHDISRVCEGTIKINYRLRSNRLKKNSKNDYSHRVY